MGLFKGWTNILRGLKHAVEAPLLQPFKDKADLLMNNSPQFRMFLDSTLGSPIEPKIKKIWADSILANMRDLIPEGKYGSALAEVWGNAIADKACRIMDRRKLKEHYKKGWISLDVYSDKRATQIQANLINRIKRPITDTRDYLIKIGFKETIDEIERFVKPIIDITEPIIEPVGEKSKQLLAKGITTFHNGLDEVRRFGKQIKDNLIDPVAEKATKVIKSTTAKVANFAKKTTSSVKSGIKKFWNRITS